MTAPSRTAQFTRLHKILKRHYTPVRLDAERTLLENLLFAACLENAHYPAAEESLAALVHNFYDLNEVRVSSVRELAEVMGALPDPPLAAGRVKRILQNVFEATYSFELESLKKINQGPAVERLRKIDGTTPFSVAYVIQASLGGHAIPLDSGTLTALQLTELATAEDVQQSAVPGLERAIPKSSGPEFASLLHQLGADFTANPYAPALHAILVEIEPGVKARLPSRRKPPEARPPEPKPAEAAAAPPKAAKGGPPPAAAPKTAAAKPADAGKKEKHAPGRPEAPKAEAPKPEPAKPAVSKKKPDAPPPAKPAEPPPAKKKEKTAEAHEAGKAKAPPPQPAKESHGADKKKSDKNPKLPSASEGLAKRKPR